MDWEDEWNDVTAIIHRIWACRLNQFLVCSFKMTYNGWNNTATKRSKIYSHVIWPISISTLRWIERVVEMRFYLFITELIMSTFGFSDCFWDICNLCVKNEPAKSHIIKSIVEFVVLCATLGWIDTVIEMMSRLFFITEVSAFYWFYNKLFKYFP
jgi:hypothetical protein